MGTVNFSVGKYAKSRGGGAAPIMSSEVITSGAFATTTTAANVEDAGGDITLAVGQVIRLSSSVDMRVRFGGVAATSTTGHFLPSLTTMEFECAEPGFVSIVDVA